MKDRSEIVICFKTFHKETSNQFNCSLRFLCSDNALKYVHDALQNYWFLMI